MKNLVIMIFFAALSLAIQAQTQPEAFIPRIPRLPANACNLNDDEREVFLGELYKLEADLEAEIAPRKKVVEEAYKNSAVIVDKDVAKEFNLSDADIQKLKNKKVSKEEKKKLADKMMQEKMNLSMQEIENLKKMSKEGKEAWAEAYTTEQIATMEGKTDSLNVVNEKNMNRYELAKEQSELAQQIAAADKGFENKINELNKEDSVATQTYLVKRNSLVLHLGDYSGEEYKRVVREIQLLEFNYCQTMTPKYSAILNDQLSSLKSLLSVYSQLEKVNADLNQSALNVQNPDFYSPGLMGLEAVKSHVVLLKGVFKYAN